MVEIRIKSDYGDLKGLLSQIPLPDKAHYVDAFIINSFNSVLDDLTSVTNTDFSHYKVTNKARSKSFPNKYDSKIVRAQIGRVIGKLEEEYGFGRSGTKQSSPSIIIFNKNQNEISLQINYTILDLINKTSNKEGKKQLKDLKDELEKKDKNWGKIKNILIWILNFSKDLFLEILPIILQKKI
ncbi:hypothetical protein KJ840_04735 [Patescibacteria group bacterium]|nr:hypothetical protein [Patescibacteria group bacterium]